MQFLSLNPIAGLRSVRKWMVDGKMVCHLESAETNGETHLRH